MKAVIELERENRAFVMFRDASITHRTVVLDPGNPELTIGRRDENDIPLEWDERVSRIHARLERLGGEWTVLDDGISRNGTFVNGQRVSSRVRVTDGDTVRVGHTTLVFRDPSSTAESITSASVQLMDHTALTKMQRRVLIALCRPYKHAAGFVTPATNQQIADELVLSIDAVKTHLRSLFTKFGVTDLPQNQKRMRVVECAFQWGVVSERDL